MKYLTKKEKRQRYIRWQKREPSRRQFIAHWLWQLMEPEYPQCAASVFAITAYGIGKAGTAHTGAVMTISEPLLTHIQTTIQNAIFGAIATIEASRSIGAEAA